MPVEEQANISTRKNDHINIARKLAKTNSSSGKDLLKQNDKMTTGLEYINLIHYALPELDYDEIRIQGQFFDQPIGLPLMIDALTGGTEDSYKINKNIGIISEEFKLPVTLGSQRIMISNDTSEDIINSFRIIREKAPNQIILANLGISEILHMKNYSQIEKIISAVQANGLAIHLNVLQEVIQPNGNRNYKDSVQKLIELQQSFSLPIIIKEVGAGLSFEIIQKLQTLGFSYFNIAGLGGTNFAKIEQIRAHGMNDELRENIGRIFEFWGIPTALSLIEANNVRKKSTHLIASGGIRTGLDIAKCLVLGADMCSMAFPFIEYSTISSLKQMINRIITELKTTMLLVNAKNIQELHTKPKLITPPLLDWLKYRNIKG